MRGFILALMILSCGQAGSQIAGLTHQREVDSLVPLIPHATGKERIDLLNRISEELAPRSFDSSFRYATEARLLSMAINYDKGKGVAYSNIGSAYYFNLQIKEALESFHMALRILEPYEPSKDVARVAYFLGLVNQYVCNPEKVTFYFKRAAWNSVGAGDSIGYIDAMQTLGTAYHFIWQNYVRRDSAAAQSMLPLIDSSILYHKITIQYFVRHGGNILADFSNDCLLAAWNFNLAVYYTFRSYSEPEGYYLEALAHAEKIKDKDQWHYLEGWIMSELGLHYYFFMNSHERGYKYARNGMVKLMAEDHYDALANGFCNMGEIELDKENYLLAEHYFLEGLKVSDLFVENFKSYSNADATFKIWGITQLYWIQMRMYESLIYLYERKGDYRRALLYHEKLETQSAVYSRDELTQQIVGLEADYEDELKRQEIDGLKKDNELRRLKMNQARIMFAGIGGTLLILTLGVLVWIQRKRFRTEQRSLVLEQRLLRSQMNPHFIFNSLTNIQNFILTEKPEKASIYLSKFAGLVRNILDNSVEEYVVLEKEIDTLENYLELQKIRFAGKFDYRIRVADEIDTETLKIPPMLAQPFIENAIEHGIKHRATPGHIDIRFSLKDHILVFEVEDDGVGRQKAREIAILQDPQHRSMATSLTRERLANLNRKLHEKIRLEITDLTNALGEATGTRVMFGIPV